MKASDEGLKYPGSVILFIASKMNCFVRSGKRLRFSSANARNPTQPKAKYRKLYLVGAASNKIKKKIGVILMLAPRKMRNTNKFSRSFKKQKNARNNTMVSKTVTFPA